MDKDLEALNGLIDEAVAKENSIAVREQELSLQDKRFAELLEERKRQADELKVLWEEVKQYMLDHNLTEHSTDFIELKLSPMGKYKSDDISKVDDSLCEIKKVLNNKKITSYLELNGKLPEGVEVAGYRLTKKFLQGDK